ncbi:MAG TPA: hypothetical protein VFH92_03730, partial [Phenylobacterium sp.]|nr:hypothetical protein [Phenylobacterium sp.]
TGVPGNHDILVKGNRIHGRGTQGIFFNSYAKFPPPKAITIVDNTVETADAPNGVLLEDDPEGVVRGNHVSTLPGSKWQTRVAVLHAKTRHCGNKIDGYLRWRAEEEDHCPKS